MPFECNRPGVLVRFRSQRGVSKAVYSDGYEESTEGIHCVEKAVFPNVTI